MDCKFCLKTTTRVYMKDSQESRRQTKQHIVSHARSVLCIFHTMLISKSASFMLYICIVVHVMWFNQSIFYFLNQYAENDLIKKLSKNKKQNKNNKKANNNYKLSYDIFLYHMSYQPETPILAQGPKARGIIWVEGLYVM